MAEVSIDLNMVRVTNDDFVKKADVSKKFIAHCHDLKKKPFQNGLNRLFVNSWHHFTIIGEIGWKRKVAISLMLF